MGFTIIITSYNFSAYECDAMNQKKGIRDSNVEWLSKLAQSGKTVFTFEDAMKVSHYSSEMLRLTLHNLKKSKWIDRIEKGKYIIIPLEAGPEGLYTEHEFVIASFLVNPYAISYWSALNFYGFTEQIPRTVYISTTRRKKKRQKEVFGIIYKFIVLRETKFLGIRKIWIENRQINITDKEKTIVDCLDHPEYCGGIIEAAKGLWEGRENLDPEKILDYVERMNNATIFKRLGFLSELLEIPWRKSCKKWEERISKGYSLLDPTMPKKGRYDSKWKLRINVEECELIEWRVH